MNSVPGLPPLPKSLSGLLTFAGRRGRAGVLSAIVLRADSRTESRMDSRPESARSHYSGVGYGASAFEPYYANGSVQGFSPRSSPRSHSSSPRNQSGGGGGTSGGSKSHSPRGSPPVPGSITGNNPRLSPAHVHVPIRQRRPSTLDSQLAVLRKEMPNYERNNKRQMCQNLQRGTRNQEEMENIMRQPIWLQSWKLSICNVSIPE
ncbi:hypothetical protein GWK47_050370 [Chionoecetes opilio]|uniref:Uncharacterized protein n=1 Tax=Chionoecetes opilio TaxID=41210 RepID=A0A8J4Y8E9_CHIOP|nr:hypothetical protein GWK47_050370 [Chionoecetes opilio]